MIVLITRKSNISGYFFQLIISYITTFSVLLCLLLIESVSAETVMFPTRASDLATENYWRMYGDHNGSNARDLDVVRKVGNGWSNIKAGTSGTNNTDHLIFGVPLYAPVDGEVVACWGNAPENPGPDLNDAGRCCNEQLDSSNRCVISACDNKSVCPSSGRICRITRSGNFMAIRKANGDVFVSSHMQSGSVPDKLCPKNNASTNGLMANANLRFGDFPEESFLHLCSSGNSDCVLERPRVRKGQYIGRAGHSGASSGPHLHIQTTRVRENDNGSLTKVGDLRPTRLNYGWLRHHTDSSIWKPFLNDTIRNPPTLIDASPFLRRGSALSGRVSQTATVFVKTNRAVTASSDADSNLVLSSWDLSNRENIRRVDELRAGRVDMVKIVSPSLNTVLVAVRDSDSNLKMLAYQVGPFGNLRRVAQKVAGRISQLDMTEVPGVDKMAVTAVRESTGKLMLIAWDIEIGQDASYRIERLGQKIVNPVSALAVTYSKASRGVITAVRDNQGRLTIIPWRLTQDGRQFSRLRKIVSESTGHVLDVAPLPKGVVAAYRNAEGNLRLQSFSMDNDGNINELESSATAGAVNEIQLLTTPHGGSNLATAVRGSDGRMYLIGWEARANGKKLRRLGSSRTGSSSGISADSSFLNVVGLSRRDTILTSVVNGDGKLTVIHWEANLID